MDLKQISAYLAQKKIKSMYLGQDLIYQDITKRELTLLHFNTAIVSGTYVAPQSSTIIETINLNLLKFGQAIVTGNYVAPAYSNITGDSLSLLQFSEV